MRALRRLRMRKRNQQLEGFEHDEEGFMSAVESSPDPEQRATTAETGQLLEEAILGLPPRYRTVVMMRDVEQMSTAETAAALQLSKENVKVRLHRGHAMIRSWLFARIGENGKDAFSFLGTRCDGVVAGVFARIGELTAGDLSAV